MKQPRQSLSTVGFAAMILAIIGMGLAIVLVLSTSIGAQSRELSALQRQAKELEYESAALATQLESLSSTASLALRATQQGMVPNPYPAFINLADGTILGTPTPVRGNEFPQLSGRAPELTPVPPTQPEPSQPPAPQVQEAPAQEPSVAAVGEPGAEG